MKKKKKKKNLRRGSPGVPGKTEYPEVFLLCCFFFVFCFFLSLFQIILLVFIASPLTPCKKNKIEIANKLGR